MEITLSLLQSVAQRSDVTQRNLAKRLGLALGLTNSYLKSCVKDGLIKVEQIPANKYFYYLTPKGFARKGKLMASYLNASMRVFREVRLECLNFFDYCVRNHYLNICVVGNNDLSEIMQLIAKNYPIKLTILKSLDRVARHTADYWVITDVRKAQNLYDVLCKEVGVSRIFCFSVLKVQKFENLGET